MTSTSIAVDFTNPGQVFASLGFLEGAEHLLGNASGRFEWNNGRRTTFTLAADGDENPIAVVLRFLVDSTIEPVIPAGFTNAPTDTEKSPIAPGSIRKGEFAKEFPCRLADSTDKSLPIVLTGPSGIRVHLGHWSDGARNKFKLYAGNRSAFTIASDMIQGGNKSTGIKQLWRNNSAELVKAPFETTVAMGGSFNFDPRGGWSAIDAGYSPNNHKHRLVASPVVEMLSAWGLEHARPTEIDKNQFSYTVWNSMLPPSLARVALCGGIPTIVSRRFTFLLGISGKNKIVTFASEEPKQWTS